MVDHAARCGIEKAPGADYDNLCRGLCCCRKAGRVKDGGCDKNQSALQDASGRICGCSTERTLSDARKCRSRHCDRNPRANLKTISNNPESTSPGKITPCLEYCQDILHAICIQSRAVASSTSVTNSTKGWACLRRTFGAPVELISNTPETLPEGAAETRAPRTVSHRRRMWKR